MKNFTRRLTLLSVLLLVVLQGCQGEDPVEKRKRQASQYRSMQPMKEDSLPPQVALRDTVYLPCDTVRIDTCINTVKNIVVIPPKKREEKQPKKQVVKEQPSNVKYIVKAKDNYYSIARQFNIPPKELMKLNHNKALKIGDTVVLK
jgi:LysM repeat protein